MALILSLVQWEGGGSLSSLAQMGSRVFGADFAAWSSGRAGAALKSELPQSITLAESPYGCMDSKLEVAYMKDGRFYVFARDVSDAC